MAAPSHYSFVAVDNNVHSNLCVIAAQQGLAQAKKSPAYTNTILCNGISIDRFATKYNVETSTMSEVKPVNVKIVAADDKPESQLCAKAAQQGVSALGMNNFQLEALYCNGRPVSSFVKLVAHK